jgi:hypothetical protein
MYPLALSVSSFHLSFIHRAISVSDFRSTLYNSIFKVAYYSQLWKWVEKLAVSTKLALTKLSLIVRAIFKFIGSFAIRLVIVELSFVVVAVFKYNLTFWH